MSRFVNPEATKRFELGPCECPGTPHSEGDWLAIRSELSGTDLAFLEESPEPFERMRFLVKGWNLIGDDGKVAPLDDDYFKRLYVDMFPAINQWLTENTKMATLPNASAEPSPASLRGRRSRTRKPKTDGSSMTPSWQPAAASGTSGTPLLSS